MPSFDKLIFLLIDKKKVLFGEENVFIFISIFRSLMLCLNLKFVNKMKNVMCIQN
ncbi:hypothetical protein ACSBR2_038082 [Camellia fascicularis]